eukprot:scaffold143165_cov18-Prasinocladus_malaysianus.AAC.1
MYACMKFGNSIHFSSAITAASTEGRELSDHHDWSLGQVQRRIRSEPGASRGWRGHIFDPMTEVQRDNPHRPQDMRVVRLRDKRSSCGDTIKLAAWLGGGVADAVAYLTD